MIGLGMVVISDVNAQPEPIDDELDKKLSCIITGQSGCSDAKEGICVKGEEDCTPFNCDCPER